MSSTASRTPAPQTWLSPKTEKRPSGIEGTGLFAREPIARGEVVAVKGGAVFTGEVLARRDPALEDSEIQIGAGLFLGPLTLAEREGSMMHLNHSCAPNVGVQGQIAFVTLRDVAAGEELTLDYAMFDDLDYSLPCRCGAHGCRGVITGQDWRRPELQRRYRGYFSLYLAMRIGH